MFKHKDIVAIFVFTFFICLSTGLFAGTTGKISGNVTDASNGHPLAGVFIHIQVTDLEGVTNKDGDYFIINIPPGTYTIEARLNGYTTILKSGVITRTDHTTPIDFSLKETLLENQETIAAEPEIILQDIIESRIVAESDDILEIPFVQDISQFMNLQVGVEENVIRGGDLESAALITDGLMVVDNRINQPMMMVNLSAVQEINIIKGGFNAEYGNVRSGLFNIVTKEGDVDHYHGSIDFRFSPAHYKHEGANIFDPDNFYLRPYLDPGVCYVGTMNGTWSEEKQGENLWFFGWNGISASTLANNNPNDDKTPEECRDMFIWEHRSEAKPEWNVPGADDLLAKYGSSLAEYKEATGRSGHEHPYGNKPDWNTDVSLGGPVPFVGKYLGDLSFFASSRINKELYRFPTARDYFQEQSTQVKLTSRISGSMKLALEGLYGTTSAIQGSTNGANNSFDNLGAYWPARKALWDSYRSMIGLSFDHVLSTRTFYNVRISAIKSATVSDGWESHALRDPTTLITFGTDQEDETPYGYGIQFLTFEDEFRISGEGSDTKDHSGVNTLNVKFDLTSQVDKYNEAKAGFEFNYDDLRTNTEFDVPCQPDRANSTVWSHYPYRLGVYLQDKLEFEGMIANLGLRLDYSDSNCEWPSEEERFSKYYRQAYRDVFLDSIPKEKVKGQLKMSPRISIILPFSTTAQLYFNYGHFYNLPPSNDMYRIGYGRPGVAGVTSIGNPSADLEKTVAYEMGVGYNVGNMFLLRAAGYYKDVTAQTGQVRLENYNGSVYYTTYRNRGFVDIKGLELSIEKRWGEWVTGWLNYNYMVETYGDTGQTVYYDDEFRNREARFFIDNDEAKPLPRPSLRANVTLKTPVDLGPAIGSIHPFGDISVSFLVTWHAGRYISWDPLGTMELEDNLQWKGERYIDLRISKRLRVGRTSFELFSDINNVLNSKYISDSGFYDYYDLYDYYRSLHLPMYEGAEYQVWGSTPGDDQVGDIQSDEKPYINMPDRGFLTFMNPRYVTFGMRMDF